MKVSRFFGFVFLSVSLIIQLYAFREVYTLGLPHYSYPGAGWPIVSIFSNMLLLAWVIRKELLSIHAVLSNQSLLIEKYFFFIRTYRRKIDLKRIIRIWVGKKNVIIKMESQILNLL